MAGDASQRHGLARALSKLGYCSRSQAASLIENGRVQLNGKVCRDIEAPVRIGADRIEVDNHVVRAVKRIYLVMNKPRGIVTTASDEKGRATVYDVLAQAMPEFSKNQPANWIAPVGRLDKASEGLLLLTNDSAWGASITAPETHLDKTYHVQIAALPSEKIMKALESGVDVAERKARENLRAKSVRMLRRGEKNCWLQITLDEGRNRQIRRMLNALEIEVRRLVRVAIGPLVLGDLPKAACRALTHTEKKALDTAMQQKIRQGEDAAHV